ncbi:MAG: ABC transporter permease [Gemmatimonadetes bacterium]|nr:ABC transporter permease [Gemmatimonadota bacterium]
MSTQIESPAFPVGAGPDRPAADTRARATVVIAPSGRWPRLDVQELWRYRSLFFFLVWRDIKVRYAQTALGVGWAVLQPLLTMGVFTLIFGRFARIPSDGVPYALFSLSALVPWTYFSTALAGAGNSLVTERNLITKVYFPRLVVPFAPVLAGLADFAVGMGMLLLVMLGAGRVPTVAALAIVPLAVLVMVLTAAGVGSWLAALNVQYRDFRYVIPFLVQVWMFASPIVYPASLVPERYRAVYALNPMVGVIEAMRSVLFGTAPLDWAAFGVSLLAAVLLFVTGTLYFRQTERVFADVA